ncbi:MAG: hypothetical protein AAGD38_18215 [Acidobacteriota bacterium]
MIVDPAIETPHGEPWYESRVETPDRPKLRVWHEHRRYWLRYADDTVFMVDAARRAIHMSWVAPYTIDDAATYLFGPILALALRLDDRISLHGSAVVVDDRAMALIGVAAIGKSTTAAAFARHGHTVLSDDVLALDVSAATPLIEPAIPCLRLWPDAVTRLFGHADALPPLTPNWDKRGYALGDSFADRAVPLGAIYQLIEGATATIDLLTGRDALLAVLANTQVTYLLDRTMRARELDVLARVLAAVPVYRVVLPDEATVDEAQGPEAVRRRLLEHMNGAVTNDERPCKVDET